MLLRGNLSSPLLVCPVVSHMVLSQVRFFSLCMCFFSAKIIKNTTSTSDITLTSHSCIILWNTVGSFSWWRVDFWMKASVKLSDFGPPDFIRGILIEVGNRLSNPMSRMSQLQGFWFTFMCCKANSSQLCTFVEIKIFLSFKTLRKSHMASFPLDCCRSMWTGSSRSYNRSKHHQLF